MITLPQEKMASRVAASILHAAGLDELITSSAAEYEELAVALATDPDRLYAMRRHLESTRETSAAFDTARWVKNFDMGLTAVWKRYESGLSPDHIEVIDNEPIFTIAESIF